MRPTSAGPVPALRATLEPISWEAADYDPLLELIGDARVVLLGEATHGTHEYYRERARITQRLIEEKGFSLVAVEADWPDAYRVNRYVRGASDDADVLDALDDFTRFPRWMWRNADVADLIAWMRAFNEQRRRGRPAVGFYGLDLYSLYSSIASVLAYLDLADADAARRARERYACFEQFGEDSQAYGYAAGLGLSASCEDAAVQQLLDLQRHAAELAARDGRIPEDEFFFAEQNARLVRNAEQYYRTMFRGHVASWNLRDRHMADTLDALVAHFSTDGEPARAVVWAHNSHIGDARATEMGAQGEWNIGQLARERFGDDAVLVGFSTYTGTVTAATDWDAPARQRWVRPALAGSYEDLLHDVEVPNFLLSLRDERVAEVLARPRLQRAIGVIYRPETERASHYFRSRVIGQFDALLHFDETLAVEPLDRTSGWEEAEAPETYPFAI